MTSTSAVKANHYLQSLDTARCDGLWGKVSELCRKVRKHAPGRTCFASAAETEASIYLLPRTPRPTPATVASYHASLTKHQESLQAVLNRCPGSPEQLPSSASVGVGVLSLEDVLLARTVLAWIFSLKGDWAAALEVVPAESELSGERNGGSGGMDYFEITKIKALVLRGIAVDNLNRADPEASLRIHSAAARLPPPTSSTPLQNSPPFLLWTERALSSYALVAYRCWLEAHNPGDSVDGVAAAFREFHTFITGLPQPRTPVGTAPVEGGLTPEREMERREVYRYYHQFLSTLLLPDGHPNRPASQSRKHSSAKGLEASAVPQIESAGKVEAAGGARDQLSAELMLVGSVYEEYLLRGLSFPGASEFHEVIGEWVDRIMENWRVSGGSGEDASVVVEILYKASTKTFHSPRILRHLFTTLTAVGNFPDAILALNTYLELVQRAKDRIAKGHMEKDFDDDKTIFETMVEGVRVICGVVGDGQKGMEMAKVIEGWIDEWNVRDAGILSDVYRGIGLANATWAREAIDGERRPDAQKAAIGAFRKGLSYDSQDTDGWYGLALVQVEYGDVDSAMESAKRGLASLTRLAPDDEAGVLWDGRGAYRRRAVPLLHLLALLMTATEDFEGARGACENVSELLSGNMMVFRDMGVGEKEGILEAKMTQIAIEEALNGVDAAVAMAGTLLDLYARLFEVTDPFVPAFEGVQPGSTLSTRPSTTSRKSRFLGARIHKKEFAVSATNLSHGSFGTQSAESDGGSTKRPKSGHRSLHHSTGLKSNPNAPRIQITEHGSSTDSVSSPKKLTRPKSVSGGTIRRMKSLGSLHSSTTSARDAKPPPEVPTPPMPSTTASSVSQERSPAGSINGRDRHHPHLFHMLKLKLQKHQLREMGSVASIVPTAQFGSSSTSFVPDGVKTPVDGASDTALSRPDLPRAEDIPNNLSRSKLPHPISAVASRITDETRGKGAEPRSVKRPTSLPEPKLKEEDERKRAGGALRLVWIFVGGLYRRAGYFQDAVKAVEEADGLGGTKGDGKADMLAEKALLALDEGQKKLALDLFDRALFVDVNHPLATIGLANILLGISTPTTNDELAATCSAESEDGILISRNRALGLLQQLTGSPRGWDAPEAWFALAKAYELGDELERAKAALWRCIALEDCRGIRGWACVRPKIV